MTPGRTFAVSALIISILFLQGLHLASPILGIRIENKAGLIRETKIKYKQKRHDGKDGQPL